MVSDLKSKQPGRLRRFCNLFLFFVVVLYLCLSPQLFYAAFEFGPVKADRYQPEQAKFHREDVFFNSKNGSRLHGWYFTTPGATKTALIHHGQGVNVSKFLQSAHALSEAGVNVLLYDYEGYGMSEGQPTNANVCNDAEAAYQYLVNTKHVKPDELIEVGFSFGTGLACRMAELHPCVGIILISPYSSLEKVAQWHVPFLKSYPAFFYPQPDLGMGNLFQKKQLPLLMVHALDDPLLPVFLADEVYEQAKGPKEYLRVSLGPRVHLGGIDGGNVEPFKKFIQGLPAKAQ